MRRSSLHQWDHIREDIILLCIEWYISYPLTYSQLKDLMEQRGFSIDPQTINSLMNQYSPLVYKRLKESRNTRIKGWRLVQIPFRLEGKKRYLYRALDAQGHTLDFIISAKPSKQKAKYFFTKSLNKEYKINTKLIYKHKKIKIRKKIITGKFILLIVFGILLFVSISYAFNLFELQKETEVEEGIPQERSDPARAQRASGRTLARFPRLRNADQERECRPSVKFRI